MENSCEHCKDPEVVKQKEATALGTQVWFAHYVFDDVDVPMRVNYHTHGFQDKFGCPDIQIVLPMKYERIHGIAHRVAELLGSGVIIAAGERIREILGGGFDVTFAEVTEGDRTVLRLILPDPIGQLDKSKQAEQYGDQWQGCKEIEF